MHRAADAGEAAQIVLNIVSGHGARLVAKSKTMVGEEIDINRHLEETGVRVVETDLGEYIVQLRGERPAHIITPAVHLSRVDVARTFHEKLGMPLTDDIPTMTAVARRVLRQTFLEAGVGISGVNFGVAETGALCLITNEGNGRMVTTLPPVHIALMGIERLVPTLDDLALMLSLLPRSATGQKLTVYTSLIHGPRRPGEVDGPLERHLVLLDNGRSAMRRSKLAEALYCIRCGACLNACPVFREIGGHAYVGAHGEPTPYPGPIGSVISPALFGLPEFGQLARASSLCGACKEACPVDIDLPALLLRVRAGETTSQPPAASPPPAQAAPAGLKLGLRLFAWMAASPRRFALAQRLAWAAGRIASPASGWLRLPAFTGWGYSRDFPRPASRPFRLRWNELEAAAAAGLPSKVADASPDPEAIPPAPPDAAPGPSLLDRFEDELGALGGLLTRCRAEDLSGAILDLLRRYGAASIQAWESRHLPPGLIEALQSAGVEIHHQPDPNVHIGLSGALAAVAETGTLVLPGGPGRPLTASLLPEVHIAILGERDIYENLPQVLSLREVLAASSVALVSGPSRTADIEMTLTIGVHGPGSLHVFCLEESA